MQMSCSEERCVQKLSFVTALEKANYISYIRSEHFAHILKAILVLESRTVFQFLLKL